MTRFVALLRGVNVGRAKRVPMADWRASMQSLGYTGVRTLLNSGNAVFDAGAGTAVSHAARIRSAIADGMGVDTVVIVKTARELAKVVEGNALLSRMTDPTRLLVAFTQDAKSLRALSAHAAVHIGDDEFHIGTHAAYLWCENGILESTAAVSLLKGLGAAGTTRNWATVEKLLAVVGKDPD